MLGLVIFFIKTSNAQNVGIGTSQPTARLHVADSSVLFTAPLALQNNNGTIPVTGTGHRMMWVAAKAAFRAGYVSGNKWDLPNIGAWSMAVGRENQATGIGSVALGGQNLVGSNGTYGVAIGTLNFVNEEAATALGFANNAVGFGSAAIGVGTYAGALGSVALGSNNELSASWNPRAWEPTDQILVIGNGENLNNRSNALTVLKNGNVGIGATTPKARLHVADSSVFFSSPSSLNSGGLTPTENGGTGLLWIAGKAALRVGRETGIRWAYDNIGVYSSSFGFNNRVSGTGGFASGSSNIVSDLYGMALGSENHARNQGSVAIGRLSQGLGDFSNAIGYGAAAQAFQSTALGRYNVPGGNATSDLLTDPILVVGNGTSDNNRSNALTILKNGNVGLGTNGSIFSKFEVESQNTPFAAINVSNFSPNARSAIYARTRNAQAGGAVYAEAIQTGPGVFFPPTANVAHAVLGVALGSNRGVGAYAQNGTALFASSVNGLAMNTSGDVRLEGIGEGNGKILVSDASGNATWRNPSIIVLDDPNGTSYLEFRIGGIMRGQFGNTSNEGFYFYDRKSNTNPFIIDNGRMGIQRTPTTNAFEVSGNASKSSSGSWLGNSDARLKKDMQPLTGALDKLKQLEGINFQWNDTKTGMKRPEGNQMGFTAQNIQQVFPEAVSTDAQGYLQTAYGTYDALLVESIKELLKKIEVLEQKVKTLENK